jgi:hypothetical protein
MYFEITWLGLLMIGVGIILSMVVTNKGQRNESTVGTYLNKDIRSKDVKND